jgi:hypothetical protein
MLHSIEAVVIAVVSGAVAAYAFRGAIRREIATVVSSVRSEINTVRGDIAALEQKIKAKL